MVKSSKWKRNHMILTFYRHIIKSFILHTCAYINCSLSLHGAESVLGNGMCPCEKELQSKVVVLPAKGQTGSAGSPEQRGQNNMRWVTNVLVILAHGKMRLLGNNRNNVTRQDELKRMPLEWWAQPLLWGSEGRRKKAGFLLVVGQAGWDSRDLSPKSWHLQRSSCLGTPSVQTWLPRSLCWSVLHWTFELSLDLGFW